MASRKYPNHDAYHVAEGQNPRLPLFSRAWALQEELLAPRVLYYGPDEVVFQCRALRACQCQNHPSGGWATAKFEYEIAYLDSSSLEEVQNSWASIIQQYSSRSLTKEADRFPALSGLVKAFESRGLGRYVAGVWTNNLPSWLIWYRQSGHSMSRRRPSIYIAPSWSWASLAAGTQVCFHRSVINAYNKPKDKDIHVQILKAVCEPAGLDITGALRSGYLAICGRAVLADLWLGHLWGDIQEHRVQRLGWESEVTLDVVPEPDNSSYPQEVYCLLVCSVKPKWSFILVLKAGDRPGEYKRCGMGTIRHGVKLTEDCERSTWYRPDLKIKTEEDLTDKVRTCDVIEAWFHGVEVQEMTLV